MKIAFVLGILAGYLRRVAVVQSDLLCQGWKGKKEELLALLQDVRLLEAELVKEKTLGKSSKPRALYGVWT